MNARERRDDIREQLIGSQNKRALLVEGSDDKLALEILLSRFLPGWEARWVVEEAGNKAGVSAILGFEPSWLGLVDRDEWDAAEQRKRTQVAPNLTVLRRFCMENYLVVPAEIWQAIPPVRQADVAGGLPAFEQRLLGNLPRYIRHGVLWHIVTPLWSGLRALGFKEKLASDSRECLDAVQDDHAIRQVLNDWDVLLDPDTLFKAFQIKLHEVQALPVEEQLRNWVHGKTFWREEANPAMNELFGQMKDKIRRKKIWEHLPAWPADLQGLFERLQRAEP